MKTSRIIPFAFLLSTIAFADTARSPFDDLSPEEIQRTVKIIRESGKFSKDVRFPVVRKEEPVKKDWLAGRAANERKSYAAIFDYAKSLMTEVVIDLNSNRILSTKNLPGIKPPVLLEEYDRARALVKADPRWQNGMKARGIKNLEDVFVDIWGPGLIRPEENKPGVRLLRALSYMKGPGAINVYSRPIEGIIVNVDLSANKVMSVWDIEKPPIAAGYKEFDMKSNEPLNEKLRPLTPVQSKGPSFAITGQEIKWDTWTFRYSMDPLQGLQLYHVTYLDKNRKRSVIYKISLAEMLVPYGAPEKTWSFRNAFDVGEYGIGKTLHPLELGKDVPANATLLPVALADDLGIKPAVFEGIGVYERDGGILWKHRNAEDGKVDIRRGRQLVITSMTTIGNYDYGVNYIFSQDGTIKVDAQLTGILLPKGSELTKNPCLDGCKPLVEKNIIAPQHQHFFNFRIDLDVDGATDNNAAEMNVTAAPIDSSNPDGNLFGPKNTIFKTEKEAVRDLNLATARKWKVFSSSSKNEFNHPVGFALMPEENAVPYLSKNSSIRKRAGFIDHPIWFTVYKDEEQSGAAAFPTTAPAGEGLPKYVANNENLENKDIVLWYTVGVTHIPRPEEWPIMSTHHAGFTLMPINFFSENPSMKVPE